MQEKERAVRLRKTEVNWEDGEKLEGRGNKRRAAEGERRKEKCENVNKKTGDTE